MIKATEANRAANVQLVSRTKLLENCIERHIINRAQDGYKWYEFFYEVARDTTDATDEDIEKLFQILRNAGYDVKIRRANQTAIIRW